MPGKSFPVSLRLGQKNRIMGQPRLPLHAGGGTVDGIKDHCKASIQQEAHSAVHVTDHFLRPCRIRGIEKEIRGQG